MSIDKKSCTDTAPESAIGDSNTPVTASQTMTNLAFYVMNVTDLLPAAEMSASSFNDAPSQDQSISARGNGTPDAAANNDASLMPSPSRPSKFKEKENREAALIHMYHVLLLLLTLRDEKPVVHLDNPNAIQILDACLEGLISDEGAVVSKPPARKGATFTDWVAKCEKYVPKIRARIEEINNNNMRLPNNKYMGPDTHPKHDLLWKFVITPEHLNTFKDILEAEKISDEIEYPEAAPEVIKNLLEDIIDGQYDFDAWVHLSFNAKAKTKFNQPMPEHPEDITEEYFEDQNHPDVILSIVKIKIPGTNVVKAYTSLFPDLPKPISKRMKKARLTASKKKRSTFFRPSLDSIIVPKKHKKYPWRHSGGNFYHRNDGSSWEFFPFTREFDAETGEYIGLRHVKLSLLDDVNPNKEEWKKTFNRYFNQLRLRDPREKPLREHTGWIAAEKKVVYRRINKWCKVNGVDQFRAKIFSEADKIDLVKEVNKIQNKGRTHGSVISWFNNAVLKEQGAIGDLVKKAAKLKKHLAKGETSPKADQFPDEAIPLSESANDEDDEINNGTGDDDQDCSDGEPDCDEVEPDVEGGKEFEDSEAMSEAGERNWEGIVANPNDFMDDADIDAVFPCAAPSSKRRRGNGDDHDQRSPRQITKEKYNEQLRLAQELAYEREAERRAQGGDEEDDMMDE
jgi:hypothetical protein